MPFSQRDPFLTDKISEALACFHYEKVGKIIRRAMDLFGQLFNRKR